MASSSSNVVGVHYRVGKKIGEGSFGVIFEGTNLLNSQSVAIKFVSRPSCLQLLNTDAQIGATEKRRSTTTRRVQDIQDPSRMP